MFHFQLIYLPIYCISLIGIISHLMLLAAYMIDPLKCFKNSGTYLLANLAVSDLLVCLAIFLRMSSLKSIMVLYFLVLFFPFGSLLTLISISIERFIIVAYPLKNRILKKKGVKFVWMMCIWLVSFVPVGKQLIFGPETFDDIVNVSLGIILVLFATFIYALTYRKLKRHSQDIALQSSSAETRCNATRIAKDKRFLRTIILIAVIALVCLLPVLLMSMALFLTEMQYHRNIYEILFIISVSLYDINFAVNPIIYFLRFPRYKKTFYRLYCKREL